MAVKLKFNNKAFREIRTSQGVRDDLRRRAEAIADAAGEGVEVLTEQEPRERAHFVIGPVTPEATRRVAEDNTLIRALDAGRG